MRTGAREAEPPHARSRPSERPERARAREAAAPERGTIGARQSTSAPGREEEEPAAAASAAAAMADVSAAMEDAALSVPVLPLEDKVLFPRTYMRLSITSASALQLLKDLVWEVQAASKPRKATSLVLGVFTRRPGAAPGGAVESELFATGTLARVVQLTRMQGSTGLSVLVQGLQRIALGPVAQRAPYVVATVRRVASTTPSLTAAGEPSVESLALRLKQLTQEYLELFKSSLLLRKSNGLINAISNSSIGELADVVVSYLPADTAAKQRVLEAADVRARCALATALLAHEVERSKLQRKIASDVQDKLEGSRKEFLLRQQLEAIKRELGEAPSDGGDELKRLAARLDALALEGRAAQVAARELRRLQAMSPSQPEFGMLLQYLEFFAELPWRARSSAALDVARVRAQLDADHFGLERVKRRITEYMAVRSLRRDLKGPILCLVGPPGVGKTSLGRSIAAATGRRFERVALGGVHDEAEVRGHRRTYIGALPGVVLGALRHAGAADPVLLLDELDKLGRDVRGDPASALLEVLDPHQNHAFTDHYLGVPFDLSNVLFVATANSLDAIPAPLRDRMEVIDVSGYSVEQKLEIARRYLLPRQVAEHGLDARLVTIDDDALRFLIMSYTREAGVRDLERQVGALCRSVAVAVVQQLDAAKTPQLTGGSAENTENTENTSAESTALVLADQNPENNAESNTKNDDAERAAILARIAPTVIDRAEIRRVLGPELVQNEVALRAGVPGVATGMSWSAAGGAILFVEASVTRAPASPAALRALSGPSAAPALTLTGQLGDVMKESAQLALSWLRAHAARIAAPRAVSLDGVSDVHVHFPEGAVSKDGPSAGAAIVCALLSSLAGVPVPADLAMTGEITLRGVILPVGGVREKVLAALRAGVRRVVLPRGNAPEAHELAREFAGASADAQVLFVSDLRELVELVFGMKVRADECAEPLGESAPMHLSML